MENCEINESKADLEWRATSKNAVTTSNLSDYLPNLSISNMVTDIISLHMDDSQDLEAAWIALINEMHKTTQMH